MWRYVLTFVGSERIYVCMEPPSTTHAGIVCFFLLVAAWVSPGRSALQSAEHWCQRRYSQIHRVMMFIIKMKQKRATRGH